MAKEPFSYHGDGIDGDWNLPTDVYGRCTWEGVKIALLMDIRRELRRIRAVAECPNAFAIPGLLRQIVKQTRPKRCKK